VEHKDYSSVGYKVRFAYEICLCVRTNVTTFLLVSNVLPFCICLNKCPMLD
jgi:hypothetical protein